MVIDAATMHPISNAEVRMAASASIYSASPDVVLRTNSAGLAILPGSARVNYCVPYSAVLLDVEAEHYSCFRGALSLTDSDWLRAVDRVHSFDPSVVALWPERPMVVFADEPSQAAGANVYSFHVGPAFREGVGGPRGSGLRCQSLGRLDERGQLRIPDQQPYGASTPSFIGVSQDYFAVGQWHQGVDAIDAERIALIGKSACWIEVHVTAVDSAPIPGAFVRVVPGSRFLRALALRAFCTRDDEGADLRGMFGSATDAAGVARLGPLPFGPDLLEIQASHPLFVTESLYEDLLSQPKLINIALAPREAVRISGKVVGCDDLPIAGARVSCLDRQFLTDESGAFSGNILHVDRASPLVLAVDAPLRARTIGIIEPWNPQALTLRMNAGRFVWGSLQDTRQEPRPGELVRASSGAESSIPIGAVSDSSGRFLFAGVDVEHVELDLPCWRTSAGPLEVQPGRPTLVESEHGSSSLRVFIIEGEHQVASMNAGRPTPRILEVLPEEYDIELEQWKRIEQAAVERFFGSFVVANLTPGWHRYVFEYAPGMWWFVDAMVSPGIHEEVVTTIEDASAYMILSWRGSRRGEIEIGLELLDAEILRNAGVNLSSSAGRIRDAVDRSARRWESSGHVPGFYRVTVNERNRSIDALVLLQSGINEFQLEALQSP